jgi:hypothetical protein
MKYVRVALALLLLSVVVFADNSVYDNARAQSCVPPPAGLVGWWPGDGDADDLAGENPGVLEGDATFAEGMVGQSFSFDGNGDYVSVSDDPSLNPVGALTVDAWIKRSAYVGPYDPIVKKAGEGTSQEHGYALEFLGYNAAFYVYFDDIGWESGPSAHVPLGEWTHVAGTYDGEYIRLYVNGAPVGTPVYHVGAIVPSGNDLNIAHDPSNAGRWYSGLIDEAEVFERALTDDEIEAIYLAGTAGKCKAVAVDIDIKPGSDPNSINLGSNGVIPVAVLTTDTFDASAVDPFTVTLAGSVVRVKGKSGNAGSLVDVDGDGDLDLVVQVLNELALEEGATVAMLEAMTYDGVPIVGYDEIRIVKLE